MRKLIVLLMLCMSLLGMGASVKDGAETVGAKIRALWQDCNVPEFVPTQSDVDALARLVYGEARSCDTEGQAGVVWCALNRVDDERFPDTVTEVVTQPGQFAGYKEYYPVLPETVKLVEDVLDRYSAERSGIKDVGRVLPREYLYFSGDGVRNYFTTTYAGGDVWDWSARSPYREIP